MSHLTDSNSPNLLRQLTVLAAVTLPLAAHAQAADNSFSVLTVVLISACGALIGFWAACYRPWFLAIALPLLIGFFAMHLWESSEILAEQSTQAEDELAYLALSWFGLPVVLVACALGRLVRTRRKKKTPIDSMFQPSIFDTD